MDKGQSQRSRQGEAPKWEAGVLYFFLRNFLTIFRLSFISDEMEMINAHGGERVQQEKADTMPSKGLGEW